MTAVGRPAGRPYTSLYYYNTLPYAGLGLTIRPMGLPQGSPSLICTWPRTTVQTGTPLTFQPCQGEGLFLLWSLLTSMTASLSLSMMVTSPSEPRRIAPFFG